MKKITIVLALVISIILIINEKYEYIVIPEEAIRVRVIANSNSKKDIEIKEKVKDNLNIEFKNILKDTKDIIDARKSILDNINRLENNINKTLNDNNSNSIFKISYGMNYFPPKEFKGVVYKEGYYESLVVTLGNGEGNNYWCVLYPPLCLLDKNSKESEVEYRIFIKDILNKYF